MSEGSFHEPVMVAQVLEHLALERGGRYLDATVGGGGHAEAILRQSESIRLLGLDRDPEALEFARRRLAEFGDRVALARGDYADSRTIFDLGEGTLAGVLLDLGVSSHQIDSMERGFTFRPGARLDMRMSPDAGVSAADLLNDLDVNELRDLFREYGEERRARRLAEEVARRRSRTPFRRSEELVAAYEATLGRPARASDLARIFQALRIAVNRELDSLERGLPVLRDLLMPGGRFVVIAYHSLEDRRVKRAFREWSRDCVCPPGLPVCRCRGRALGHEPFRGPARPTAEEVERNPRARSARLRVWERAA